MTELKNRERYTSVSQRQMVKDNHRFLIEAILDPNQASSLYEYYYPDYLEIISHQNQEKRILRKTLNSKTIVSYISRLTKFKGFIRHSSREIFLEYLLQLPEIMCQERRQAF